MRWLGIVRFDFVFGADIKLMCGLKIEKARFIIIQFVILLQKFIVKMKFDLNSGCISNYRDQYRRGLVLFWIRSKKLKKWAWTKSVVMCSITTHYVPALSLSYPIFG
jgi:ABC transporter, ATP-binding protein